MTATAFSEAQMAFTRAAHQAAQMQVYRRWFPDGIEFEDAVFTRRDLDYAIDCQLAVICARPPFHGCTTAPLRAPLRVSVQERYRRVRDLDRYGDEITITEWNLASNQPSELHKFAAQMFVYGFYDDARNVIVRAAAFSIPAILTGMIDGRLRYMRKSRGDQHFIALHVPELRRAGAEMFTYEEAPCSSSGSS
jgi:hypothetical protein